MGEVNLMIIPAATARRFAGTPESMALWSALLGVAAVVFGVMASLQWDFPTGPAIVAFASMVYLISCVIRH